MCLDMSDYVGAEVRGVQWINVCCLRVCTYLFL